MRTHRAFALDGSACGPLLTGRRSAPTAWQDWSMEQPATNPVVVVVDCPAMAGVTGTGRMA